MTDIARVQCKQQWATRLVLFNFGFAISTWAPMIPFVQSRLDLSDGHLGLMVLCFGMGSIVAMPVAGMLAGRFGCRPVVDVALALVCASLPVVATSSNGIATPIALFLFGICVGTFDCVANLQAIVVERESGRKMMSGFHAIFSLGCILGAALTSLWLSFGYGTRFAATSTCIVIVAINLVIRDGILARRLERSAAAFVWPSGYILFIGALCFIAFLAEGSILDWGAVFLVNERSIARQFAGIGFAVFSIAMMTGRLAGDGWCHRFGETKVAVAGGMVAVTGFGLALVSSNVSAAIVGYGLIGLGIANLAPIFLSTAGRQTDMPEYVAVPLLVTMGYSGILAGPALLGFISHLSHLTVAFAMVAALLVLLCIAVMVRRIV
jgi:fucose permease